MKYNFLSNHENKLNIYKELLKNREEHRKDIERSFSKYKPSEYQIAIEIKQAKDIEIVKSIYSKL